MSIEFTRRRAIALAGFLTGSIGLPTKTFAQKEKDLPECRADRTFGRWEAHAFVDNGSLTYSDGADDAPRFSYNYKIPSEYKDHPSLAPKEYQLEFSAKKAPTKVAYEVAVSWSGTTRTDSNVVPRGQSRQDDGSFWITLDLTPWFPENNNPLKQASNVKIEVRNDGLLLVSVELDASGFSEGQQFVLTEASRLIDMAKRKECEECFLTTACCELVGLPDDCFELTSLRQFRDGPLPEMPGGMADVDRYYAYAPRILSEIRRRGDESVLLRYYLTHILPCAVLAKAGLADRVRRRYAAMMRELEFSYLASAE